MHRKQFASFGGTTTRRGFFFPRRQAASATRFYLICRHRRLLRKQRLAGHNAELFSDQAVPVDRIAPACAQIDGLLRK